MAHINLLPWRENLRSQRKKDFGFQILGAVIVTLLALVYWHLHVQGLIDHQESRNNLLKKEIAAVDKKIEEIKELEKKRSQLISRMDVIQNLQISRPHIVHLFDELVETIPEGAYLIDLAQKGTTVTMNGRAQSNARVTAYMRNIDESLWLGNALLKIIQTDEKTDTEMSHFRLTAKQIGLVEPTAESAQDADDAKGKGKKGKKKKKAKKSKKGKKK